MHATKLGVLVTRPDTLAGPLMRALEKSGATVWHFPTLEIKFLTQAAPVQQAIKQLTDYSWHIFVSRHAVQAVLPQIVQTWSMLDLMQLNWAAVGPGTAKELAHFISTDIVYPHEKLGAAALWAELKDKIRAPARVLIWCGDKPTPGLKGQMVMCYTREKTVVKLASIEHALKVGHIDYVIISSGTSLEHVMASLNHTLLNACKLVVISERLITLARRLGFSGEIILAQGADDQSILNIIKG